MTRNDLVLFHIIDLHSWVYALTFNSALVLKINTKYFPLMNQRKKKRSQRQTCIQSSMRQRPDSQVLLSSQSGDEWRRKIKEGRTREGSRGDGTRRRAQVRMLRRERGRAGQDRVGWYQWNCSTVILSCFCLCVCMRERERVCVYYVFLVNVIFPVIKSHGSTGAYL